MSVVANTLAPKGKKFGKARVERTLKRKVRDDDDGGGDTPPPLSPLTSPPLASGGGGAPLPPTQPPPVVTPSTLARMAARYLPDSHDEDRDPLGECYDKAAEIWQEIETRSIQDLTTFLAYMNADPDPEIRQRFRDMISWRKSHKLGYQPCLDIALEVVSNTAVVPPPPLAPTQPDTLSATGVPDVFVPETPSCDSPWTPGTPETPETPEIYKEGYAGPYYAPPPSPPIPPPSLTKSSLLTVPLRLGTFITPEETKSMAGKTVISASTAESDDGRFVFITRFTDGTQTECYGLRDPLVPSVVLRK